MSPAHRAWQGMSVRVFHAPSARGARRAWPDEGRGHAANASGSCRRRVDRGSYPADPARFCGSGSASRTLSGQRRPRSRVAESSVEPPPAQCFISSVPRRSASRLRVVSGLRVHDLRRARAALPAWRKRKINAACQVFNVRSAGCLRWAGAVATPYAARFRAGDSSRLSSRFLQSPDSDRSAAFQDCPRAIPD